MKPINNRIPGKHWEDNSISCIIADDDDNLLNLYDKILTQKGYDVVGKANDGKKIVDLYKNMKKKPDVILMDYQMPYKDGIQAMKEILVINPDAIVIFISGQLDIKEEALSLGARGFINKSSNIKKIFKQLKACMNKRKVN